MDNILNARIKLKYDTLANWELVKNSFIPLAGEVIIYQIPAQQTSTGLMPPTVGIKVGNGSDYLKDLPWIQAVAGDVYAWAKKSAGEAGDITSTILKNNIGDTQASATTTANVQEVLNYLTTVVNTLNAGTGSGSIESQILSKLQQLDYTDPNYEVGKFVTKVTQTDGTIEVTHAALDASDIPNISTDKLTSGILPVNRGGTGANTFTSGQVLVGNGADAISTKAIDTTVTPSSSNLVTSGAVSAAISTATAGLTGAMHFIGKSTIDLSIAANSAANPTISGYDWSKKATGDVVLNSTGNKEYVWNGTTWIELGDEGSYALNTITVTGTNGLTGGGSLQANRTIEHAVPTGASAGVLGSTTDSNGRKYIQTLTTDAYGHVTDATYATETVTDTTYTFAEGSTNGAFSVTPSGGNTQSVPIHGLENIATNATAYNLDEINISHSQDVTVNNVTHTGSNNEKYFILNCGDAFKLVDNASTT